MNSKFDWKWTSKVIWPAEEALRALACMLATISALTMVFVLFLLGKVWVLPALLILGLMLYAVGAFVNPWVTPKELNFLKLSPLSRAQKILFVFMVAWEGVALGWLWCLLLMIVLNHLGIIALEGPTIIYSP